MKYEEKSESLDQYDGWYEFLDGKEDRYAPLLGYFLIHFSVLEHSLNLALAEILHSRTHEIGYVVVEKLSLFDKIDLFRKLYLGIVSPQSKKGKDALLAICKRLEKINTFRNMIAHANWSTIDAQGFVRTRIKVDPSEGHVIFRNVRITRAIISTQTQEVKKLADDLDDFSQKALEGGFEKKPKGVTKRKKAR